MKKEPPLPICWVVIKLNDDILFFLTTTLFLSKVNIHSSSHNSPNDMRLEWRLGKFSACFSWLDKFCIGIWDWCVDAIVDELGIFTLIGYSYGYLLWTIVVRSSRYCPVYPHSDIVSFACGCGGN